MVAVGKRVFDVRVARDKIQRSKAHPRQSTSTENWTSMGSFIFSCP